MKTAEDRVAQTILDQIGVGSLMRLGTHDVHRFLDAVRFKIKVAKPGQTRARIMQVQIKLTPKDLYDLSIGFCDMNRKSKTYLDWYSLEDQHDLFAEDMVNIMRQLAIRA
jgi:hypothetical protein